MSRIIKMVDEIKEYYNLNDTLLASDLGIMQQTIRGWREGRKPNLDNYNKVKKMYEEMKQEAVDESIVQRFEALEEKVEKKPYEVEVPEDLEDYFYVDETGIIYKLSVYVKAEQIKILNRGLAFKTKEEAEQFDKERILINKFKDWAKEHQRDWTPDWKDFDEYKFSVTFDFDDYEFLIKDSWYENAFSKLPYFISRAIAKQFIEEFGDEIKEVLC